MFRGKKMVQVLKYQKLEKMVKKKYKIIKSYEALSWPKGQK